MRCATFLLLGLLAANVPAARGCKCPRTPTPRRAARTATLLFAGRLASTRHLPRPPATTVTQRNFGTAYPLVQYKFVPDRIWRGQPADTITLTSGRTNCAVYLQAGYSYVVYTSPGGELSTCGRLIGGNLAAERAQLDCLFRRPRQSLPAPE